MANRFNHRRPQVAGAVVESRGGGHLYDKMQASNKIQVVKCGNRIEVTGSESHKDIKLDFREKYVYIGVVWCSEGQPTRHKGINLFSGEQTANMNSGSIKQ
jgi:hypothetical protein